MQTKIFKITGMTCDGCTSKIARALKATPGAGEVNVSLTSEVATVQYDEKLTSVDQLKLAVASAGYGVDGNSSLEKPKAKSGCCS